MKKSILVLVLLSSPMLHAEPSRLKDVVDVKLGHFLYESYSLCEVKTPNSKNSRFQVRTSAKAPAKGVVSRDNFVAYVTAVSTLLQANWAVSAGAAPSQFSEIFDCDEIKAAIGKVDIEVSVVMTADGIQVEYTDHSTGQNSRRTTKWEE